MKQELTLKELQSRSLDILRSLHDFCVAHDIPYSLDGGTLLGAIRHNGFIPWDDDIDVMMTRPNFERFCTEYQSEEFKLFSPHNKDCYISFARICDMVKTEAKDNLPFCPDYKGGVWIDLFPIDGAEDDFDAFSVRIGEIQKLRLKQMRMRSAKARISDQCGFEKRLKLVVKKIIYHNGSSIGKIQDAMNSLVTKIRFGETSHWSDCACPEYGAKNYQELDDYSEYMLHDFEGDKFLMIKGWDRVLKTMYGDYMTMPPVENRKPKNSSAKFYWKDDETAR